jgi:serine/threonine-protein kinase
MSAQRLGRYRLAEKIGEGGTAEVFAGVSEGAEGFAKPVAIKRLREAPARAPELRSALIAEAEIARGLNHGNIVQILDLGVDDGDRPYLVVEFVDGVSLADLLDEIESSGEPLAIADALYVADQLLAALEYAHSLTDADGESAGVIHRDVKPANVLVSRDGLIKLGDFGLARPVQVVGPTSPGMVKGTLGYLSPEQARAGALDARTDQFSAAVVIVELLCGRNPLASGSGGLVKYLEILEGGVPSLEVGGDIDEELAAIVGKALAIERGERYAGVGELRRALQEWWLGRGLRPGPEGIRDRVRALRGEKVGGAAKRKILADPLAETQQPGTVAVDSPPARRSRVWLAAAALAVAGLGLGGLALLGDRGAAAPPVAIADAAPMSPPIDSAPSLAIDAAPAPPIDAAPPAPPIDAAIEVVRPATRPGRLQVNTLPYAVVSVGGREIGGVPVEVSLPPGEHRVILENAGLGRRAETTVVIQSDRITRITRWP